MRAFWGRSNGHSHSYAFIVALCVVVLTLTSVEAVQFPSSTNTMDNAPEDYDTVSLMSLYEQLHEELEIDASCEQVPDCATPCPTATNCCCDNGSNSGNSNGGLMKKISKMSDEDMSSMTQALSKASPTDAKKMLKTFICKLQKKNGSGQGGKGCSAGGAASAEDDEEEENKDQDEKKPKEKCDLYHPGCPKRCGDRPECCCAAPEDWVSPKKKSIKNAVSDELNGEDDDQSKDHTSLLHTLQRIANAIGDVCVKRQECEARKQVMGVKKVLKKLNKKGSSDLEAAIKTLENPELTKSSNQPDLDVVQELVDEIQKAFEKVTDPQSKEKVALAFKLAKQILSRIKQLINEALQKANKNATAAAGGGKEESAQTVAPVQPVKIDRVPPPRPFGGPRTDAQIKQHCSDMKKTKCQPGKPCSPDYNSLKCIEKQERARARQQEYPRLDTLTVIPEMTPSKERIGKTLRGQLAKVNRDWTTPY